MNSLPMILRFCSGSATPLSFSQDPPRGFPAGALQANSPQHRQHELKLFFSQQAVVHEDAIEPLPDGAVDQRGGHGGVPSSAQGAKRAPAAELVSNRRDSVLDER